MFGPGPLPPAGFALDDFFLWLGMSLFERFWVALLLLFVVVGFLMAWVGGGKNRDS